MRRWALLVGLLGPGAPPVLAEPATTVVLVRTHAGDSGRWRAAEERTRDELRMMGLRVAEVEVREDSAAIEHAMAEHGARVAVRLEREGEAGSAAMWWWTDEHTALSATRIEGLALKGRAAAAVAALRAAELVRAGTLPRGPAEVGHQSLPGEPGSGAAGARDSSQADAPTGVATPEPVLVPMAPVVTAWRTAPTPGGSLEAGYIDPLEFVDPAPPRVAPLRPRDAHARGQRAVGLYAGVGGGPGGAGALMGGGLALRLGVARALALQAEAQAALSPTWLSGQGRSFRVGLAGVRAALVFVTPRAARVGWRLGLGGGLSLAWARGRTPDLLRSSQDRAAVGVLRASVHMAIRAREQLRLVVGVELDQLLPPLALRVLDVEVARLGAPLIRGVLGLEWDWSPARRR